MANVIKCFDVVDSVVREANKRFGEAWKLNQNAYDVLQMRCNSIDAILKEFGGVSIEVEVDEIRMTISVVIECEDITLKSKVYKLCDIIKIATTCKLSVLDKGILRVEFVFPSIWDWVGREAINKLTLNERLYTIEINNNKE